MTLMSSDNGMDTKRENPLYIYGPGVSVSKINIIFRLFRVSTIQGL